VLRLLLKTTAASDGIRHAESAGAALRAASTGSSTRLPVSRARGRRATGTSSADAATGAGAAGAFAATLSSCSPTRGSSRARDPTSAVIIGRINDRSVRIAASTLIVPTSPDIADILSGICSMPPGDT
jgi:hypothetical protein